MGCQTVDAYSIIGRVIALYVLVIVSFCFPQEDAVRLLSTFSVLLAFVEVILACSLKFSLGSKVSPNILGCFIVGISSLLICRFSLLLNSAGSGVNRVD